jgi:hypothetical protein
VAERDPDILDRHRAEDRDTHGANVLCRRGTVNRRDTAVVPRARSCDTATCDEEQASPLLQGGTMAKLFGFVLCTCVTIAACGSTDGGSGADTTVAVAPTVSTATPTTTTAEPASTEPPETDAPVATEAPAPASTATTVDTRTPLFDGTPEVAPGSYVVDRLAVPIGLTVPAGWSTFGDFALLGPDGSYVAFWNVADVFRDACHWTGGIAGIGPEVEDLVAGLVDQSGSDTTEPRPLDVDGFTGSELVLSAPAVDFTTCDGGDFKVWVESDGGERFYDRPGETETLWILDLAGTRGVINFGSFGPMSAAAKAQIEEIVGSLDIG